MRSMFAALRAALAIYVAVTWAAPCAAQDDLTLTQLDESLTAARGFEQGGNAAPLVEAERIVLQLAPDSPLREQVEDKLLAALQAATTGDERDFLCRQLRVVGTDRSVPQLEPLLADPQQSHLARYALGSLHTAAASAALHRGLSKTTGAAQAGIIHTLADLDYQPAKPELIALLTSPEASVAQAAARALGRLAGDESIEALTKARPAAASVLAAEIDNALLNCAASLVAAGSFEQAAQIYARFDRPDQPQQLRLAGLRGLVIAEPQRAAERLIEAIGGQDAELSRSAISLIGLAQGEAATAALAGVLDRLPVENQALILRALGDRGDSGAASAIAALARSEEPLVRLAALEALGQAGDAGSIAVLLEAAAAAESNQRDVARRSLLLLSGPAVDERLIAALNDSSPAVQAEAIRALAGRGAVNAAQRILAAASSPEAAVRREAIAALGSLAGIAELDAIIELALAATETDDQTALVDAAGRIFQRIGNKESCAAAVLARLDQAPPAGRATLLRLLGKSAAPQALPVLRTAWKTSDATLQQAAVQSLAQWPDADVQADLLDVIAADGPQELKQTALEGYLRIADNSADPTASYLRVIDRVQKTGDKKLVLAGVGVRSDSPAALDLVLKYLDDPALQATAGLAALRIANRIQDRDQQRARAALEKVLAIVKHDDVHQRAQEVLNDMDKFQDHILQWVGAGPYSEKGKDGQAIYQTAFEPETRPAAEVSWQPITKGIGSWEINLEPTYGGLDYVAAYVRTRVWSETQQEALLEMGADDAIKAWINGKLVFDRWTEGGAAPRQKRAPVTLVKGWNDLMLKVVDQQGGWVFACRVRQPDGTALPGLRAEAP